MHLWLSQKTLAQGQLEWVQPTPLASENFRFVAEWQGQSNDSRDCVLHLQVLARGQPCDFIAGSVSGVPSAQPKAPVRLQYGAGSSQHSVDLDAFNGTYQLPACDLVRVLWDASELATAQPSFSFAMRATIAQGQFPGARPPTWTMTAGGNATGALSGGVLRPPIQARAVELAAYAQLVTDNAWATLDPLTGATYGQSDTGRRVYVNNDGTSNPAYAPAPLWCSMREDGSIGPPTYNLSASAATFVVATFFLAL